MIQVVFVWCVKIPKYSTYMVPQGPLQVPKS